MLYIASLNP